MKKKTLQKLKQSLRVSGAASRAGQDLGSRFSRLNVDDARTVNSFHDAIHRGSVEAQNWDNFTEEVSQDSDFLREMGFWGRDED